MVIFPLYTVRARIRFSYSDGGHFLSNLILSSSLLTDSLFGVLQELERGLCGVFVLHLIDSLPNKAQQIVDVLSLHKVVLLVLVEEQICIQDLDQKVQVLWLGHADLRSFEGFSELSHHLLTLTSAVAEVQVRGQRDCFSLKILLQQLA